MRRAVKRGVPIAFPWRSSSRRFYTSLAHFARPLDDAGADGLVLFNRFYQPDIDVDELEVELASSSSRTRTELLLRLRWLAIVSGHVSTPRWPSQRRRAQRAWTRSRR